MYYVFNIFSIKNIYFKVWYVWFFVENGNIKCVFKKLF